MPSRPALKSNHTEAPADDESPSTSEAMAAEARAEKARKPKGSPQLWPFAQLPRRQRAEFFGHLRGVDMEALSGLTKKKNAKPGLRDAADLYALLASVEDALRVVAVPDSGVDFDEWADKVDDEQLLALFQWYMDRFAPGEAKPSSN